MPLGRGSSNTAPVRLSGSPRYHCGLLTMYFIQTEPHRQSLTSTSSVVPPTTPSSPTSTEQAGSTTNAGHPRLYTLLPYLCSPLKMRRTGSKVWGIRVRRAQLGDSIVHEMIMSGRREGVVVCRLGCRSRLIVLLNGLGL